MNSIVRIAEKIIGRREHDKNKDAPEYIDANLNDLWFALLIAYIWILNALISVRRAKAAAKATAQNKVSVDKIGELITAIVKREHGSQN